MTTADILLALLIVAFVAWIAWEIRRAPIVPNDKQDVQPAIDSVRAALESDARFDELRDYTTTNHVRAGTAWGKEL